MQVTIPAYRTIFKNKSKFLKQIGKGEQGIVDRHILLRTDLLQSPDLNGQRKTNLNIVAVKNFFPDTQGDIDASALRELHVYFKLMGCANIVQLLDIEIVTRIDHLIVRIMIPYHTSDINTFIQTIPFKEKIKYGILVMYQLLNGLYQLYEKNIIHRDIKPDNIFIDYEFQGDNLLSPKSYIADFGQSIQLPCDKNYHDISMEIFYAPLYRAPELLTKHTHYTEKTDTWAMGLVLLEYLIKIAITEPTMALQTNNPGKDDQNVLYTIFANLTTPLTQDKINYNRMEKLQLHDNIDVRRALREYLTLEQLNTVPERMITTLILMLAINPDDRANISQLVGNIKTCVVADNELRRGDIISPNIDTMTFYNVVIEMIDMSNFFKITPTSCLFAINLVEKYLANYNDVDNARDLKLIGITYVLLVSKIREPSPPFIDDIVIVFPEYTTDDIRNIEPIVLERMNYILITCEIDDLIHEVNELVNSRIVNPENFPDFDDTGMKPRVIEVIKSAIIDKNIIYPMLVEMYNMMYNDGQYSGTLFSFELVEYLMKVNDTYT